MQSTLSPADPLSITLWEVTCKNVEQVRVINSACLPVTYTDKFYLDLLEPNRTKLNRIAYFGEDVIAGSVCCRLEPAEGSTKNKLYIMTLGVLEKYARHRIGSALIEYILKECTANVAEVYLHVQTSNTRAIEFYKKFGFVQGPVLENYYKKYKSKFLSCSMVNRIEPPHCYVLTKTL